MPAVPSTPRVKLRSTSRRVPRTRSGSEAATMTEAEPEPTMRLSRALLVMLLLHVVAVGGFIASSRIREHDLHRSAADPTAAVEADDSLSAPRPSDAPQVKSEPNAPATDNTASALRLIEDRTAPSRKPEATPASVAPKNVKPAADPGSVYVVGRGETVYTIAQKLKVSPESLLKLNQIDDPKKLNPGQKLRVPPANKTKGK